MGPSPNYSGFENLSEPYYVSPDFDATPKMPILKSRLVERKRKRSILAFAQIFEEYKNSIAAIESELGSEVPADLETENSFVFNFYNHQWKKYCGKWNSKRGNPPLDTSLFSKEANKYLNELRTMQASQAAE